MARVKSNCKNLPKMYKINISIAVNNAKYVFGSMPQMIYTTVATLSTAFQLKHRWTRGNTNKFRFCFHYTTKRLCRKIHLAWSDPRYFHFLTFLFAHFFFFRALHSPIASTVAVCFYFNRPLNAKMCNWHRVFQKKQRQFTKETSNYIMYTKNTQIFAVLLSFCYLGEKKVNYFQKKKNVAHSYEMLHCWPWIICVVSCRRQKFTFSHYF